MKPDPTKVTGMRHGSYDKLNDKGYVPEETVITNGDIIIGKVSPIQSVGNSNKLFKDNSESYKGHESAVIDKVYKDIFNHEGYAMIKIRTRSERIPHIGDKFCCFSSTHDILTTEGWIAIDKVTKEHKVACLVNGDTLEYHHPSEIQEYDYDGEMYHINSNQVNLFVTPNHRMYVAKRNEKGKIKKYKIENAENIYHQIRHYKKNVGNYSGTEKKTEFLIPANTIDPAKFILPSDDKNNERIIDLESWLILFGIWIAEGSINNNTISFAANKLRVRSALVEVCKELGFKLNIPNDQDMTRDYTHEDDKKAKWTITGISQLYNYLKQFPTSVNKYLPNWCWDLSMEHAKTLIHGLWLGDGHALGQLCQYDTSSKKLADDFQRLCLHAGWSGNIKLKEEIGYTKTIRDTNVVSTKEAWRISIIEKQNEPKINKAKKGENIKNGNMTYNDSKVKFTGKVYCCTVPTEDGVIYIRRNMHIDENTKVDNKSEKGKIPVWCGNSRHGYILATVRNKILASL
ncbi:MAG: intein-containing DNA-directed RNA polymerase subunit 2 [Edafosvirus sp.]|uniref:DNA-directed RNA polymerase n=1 Tax=Edafosvirus sp. TaxID=2487765 RepID=A0A3G4ZYP5_9VIRU|nr:MAG: intein-containing DNA-directed RNA polymerase subunit 2 [Edafosvirus sp.]